MTTLTPTLAAQTCKRLPQLPNNPSGRQAVRPPAGISRSHFVQRFLLALMRSLAVPAA